MGLSEADTRAKLIGAALRVHARTSQIVADGSLCHPAVQAFVADV